MKRINVKNNCAQVFIDRAPHGGRFNVIVGKIYLNAHDGKTWVGKIEHHPTPYVNYLKFGFASAGAAAKWVRKNRMIARANIDEQAKKDQYSVYSRRKWEELRD